MFDVEFRLLKYYFHGGGGTLNRTYRTYKTLYIQIFYQQYLVLYTMAPRKYCRYYTEWESLAEHKILSRKFLSLS